MTFKIFLHKNADKFLKKLDEKTKGHLIELLRKLKDYPNIELDVPVPSDMSIEEVHEVAHQVENRIMQEIPDIKDVTIHIEPIKDSKTKDK